MADRTVQTPPGTAPSLDLSTLPPEYAQALQSVMAAVDLLATSRVGDLDGRQALIVSSALASLTGRLEVLGARMLPVVEADGLWAARGGTSFARWVAGEHRLSMRAAQARIRLGRALRDNLPVTADAALAGVVPAEAAQVLAGLGPTTELRRHVLADPAHECNEDFLVRQARVLSVDHFRMLTRHWAAAADPDADDRGYVEASDREFLDVERVADGYHLAGMLTIEHGQSLKAALSAVTPVPAAGDDRTSGQRRAQALGDLARVVLDHGIAGTGRAVRPRIGVLVPYAVLRSLADAAGEVGTESAPGAPQGVPALRGPVRVQHASGSTPPPSPTFSADALTGRSPGAAGPHFEDGTPVPRALLDKLACDSEINRYVFGPQSEVLDVGRAERTFTGSLRAAIIARDKHCQFPGCHAPPAISEAHHVRHWSRDRGDTSVRNGILLCYGHHDRVHRKHIEIRRRGARWVFTLRTGEVVPDGEAVP